MDAFRNEEIKKQLFRYALFAAAAIFAGTFISIEAASLVGLVCAVSAAAFFRYTWKRYQKTALLSDLLDQVLHGDDQMAMISDEAGDLAVLSSQIYKMTIRLREQAERLQADKLYLRDSVADISHQLRTPLTTVRMLVKRLGRETSDSAVRQKYLWEVNHLLTRIEWLIAALLKISQLESGTVTFQQELVSVEALVRKAAEPLAVPMELREQSLMMQIPAEAAYCGDFLWSVQAIENIIKNCMTHTPNGGEIRITAQANPVYTEIIISDTGPGIAPGDLPHIFERFYKGQKSGDESYGIGLALARMIIRQQNGTIKAANRAAGGAEFHIRFYKGAV